ncbi:MAG: HNH endonuclease [Pirellulales bacterium]
MRVDDGNINTGYLEAGNCGALTFPDDGEKELERIKVPEIMALLERQNFRCALTGQRLTPSNASLDHVIPVSRGGAHAIENMQVVLTSVNHAKGTMTQDEFIQLCHEVVAWADRSQDGEANGRS